MANEHLRSRRIMSPPATGSVAFDTWLREVVGAINGLPISIFSTATGPNSRVTAPEGFLGIEVGSGVTRLWVKQTGSSNTGWSHFSHIGGV